MAQGFHIVDYVLFSLTILVSLGIGLYHALAGGGQKTTNEYLMGNRQLKIIPVALSILVSFISAVGILGTPVEMYAFGTQYSMHVFAGIAGCIGGAFLFVPLLYPLKLTSSFEYFELRYRSRIPRVAACIIMLLNNVFMNGTGLFAPSLALEAVTGFPVWASIIICGASATVYTALGGMKAVIWTDVFQSVIIFVGLLAVCILGVMKVGGFAEVWRVNEEWGRIEFFNFDPDPRTRTTFWSSCVLMAILWTCFTTSQMAVQRYCALPTMRAAKISILLNIPGFVINGVLTCSIGVIIFAYYAKLGCDPLSAGKISNLNQVVPYFVMDVMGYPGLPGLFVACLYSGALSTASSSLNAMAAVTWEDLLKPNLGHLPAARQALIAKILVAVYGGLSIAVGFVVAQLGGTFVQIVFSVLGTTAGPIVGMFFLGGTYRKAGPIGAMLGGVIGLVFAVWMSTGSFALGINVTPLPLPNRNCPRPNATQTLYADVTPLYDVTNGAMTSDVMHMAGHYAPPARELHGLENLYAVSYFWYPIVGISCVMFVGILTSFIPGMEQKGKVPKKYLFPCLRGTAFNCCSSDDTESDDNDDGDDDDDNDEVYNATDQYKMPYTPVKQDAKHSNPMVEPVSYPLLVKDEGDYITDLDTNDRTAVL